MGTAILKREVLPPRQAPSSLDASASEECVRAVIMRSIWVSAALVGLTNVATRLLGTW